MATFHYVVKAKLIRHIKGSGEIEFLQFEEKFENENPILARNLAFKHYQNYIDVLLQGKQKKYFSDKQARDDLKSFVGPTRNETLVFGETEIDFSNTFNNGIGVYLIINNPLPATDYIEPYTILGDKYTYSNLPADEQNDEVFIHGIGNIGCDTNSLIFELEKEYEYYTFYNYETDNQVIEVVYCNSNEWEEGYRDDEPATYIILETPFDWTGLDKPYWWGEQETIDVEDPQQIPKTIEQIIQEGESNQVEFKPALLFNFSTGRGGIGVKGIIAKAICAFLNSNGGFLIIGVTDKGEPQGLSFDFSLSEDKNEKDFFMLEFDQMLEHFLSFSIKSNVSGQFYQLNEKDIFVVTVTPSIRRPIFMKGQNGKEFYLRGEASSRQLTDIEELANYCIEKWGIL
jgi:hypothetical protein